MTMIADSGIKLKLVDFWANPSMFHHYLHRVLATRNDVEYVERPDYLFYSCYGCEHRKYAAVKIYFTGENFRPNFFDCDYSLSFDYDDYRGRNYRLPFFLIHRDPSALLAPKDPGAILTAKTKFCNFVFSNPAPKERIRLMEKLSRYKKVDCGGKVLNNIGYNVTDKLAFISDYKFTIAFENTAFPGYTTEKIYQPMLVNSLPIYWGNPNIATDFNTKSFINANECSSLDEVVDKVIEADKNDDVYCRYFSEPYFAGNRVPESFTDEAVGRHLGKIFESGLRHGKLKRMFRPKIYGFRWRYEVLKQRAGRLLTK